MSDNNRVGFGLVVIGLLGFILGDRCCATPSTVSALTIAASLAVFVVGLGLFLEQNS